MGWLSRPRRNNQATAREEHWSYRHHAVEWWITCRCDISQGVNPAAVKTGKQNQPPQDYNITRLQQKMNKKPKSKKEKKKKRLWKNFRKPEKYWSKQLSKIPSMPGSLGAKSKEMSRFNHIMLVIETFLAIYIQQFHRQRDTKTKLARC